MDMSFTTQARAASVALGMSFALSPALALEDCGTTAHLKNSSHCALQLQFCRFYPNLISAIGSAVSSQVEMHGANFDARDAIADIYMMGNQFADDIQVIKLIGEESSESIAYHLYVFQSRKIAPKHTWSAASVVDHCASGTLDFLNNFGPD